MIEENIITTILNNYEKNKKVISFLKSKNLNNKQNFYCLEENIINDFKINKKINLKVVGSDSGFVNQQFNFINILLVKEVSVFFEYVNGNLVSSKYYPKSFNYCKPYLISGGLDLEDIMWNTSILRLKKEIDVLKMAYEKNNAQLLLLDGSIIPQYINKPTKDGKLKNDYNFLIKNFITLFDLAKKNKSFIVGCVEDSRSNRFFNFLNEEVIDNRLDNNLFDNFVLNFLLDENQRTCVLKYSKDVFTHPILKDFPKDISENLYVCYFKLSNDDYPLRIEFLYFKEYGLSLYDFTNKIIEYVSSISYYNKKYTYPSVLIEADIRARLNQNEITTITNAILQKIKSKGFRFFRRNSRLF